MKKGQIINLEATEKARAEKRLEAETTWKDAPDARKAAQYGAENIIIGDCLHCARKDVNLYRHTHREIKGGILLRSESYLICDRHSASV